MTVRELIRQLSNYDKDTVVVIPDYQSDDVVSSSHEEITSVEEDEVNYYDKNLALQHNNVLIIS